MYIYDIIEKKRQAQKLTKEEIDFVVKMFTAGEILPEQMSALLMAIAINGMTDGETYELTKSMQATGKTLKFAFDTIDKHSTGGVGDSTTLLIVPVLACLGLKVSKMSGGSLGFTGGTIDKLKVFEGYNPVIEEKAFTDMLQKIGCAIISQSNEIAKADKMIYALRDRTATVDSIPLIASSIMSKKLASGAHIIMLDVKYGLGAFMKTKEDAVKLAKLMVKIAKKDGKKAMAVVTNMDAPLSLGVGCNLEVYSVLQAFRGENSSLLELSKYLSAKMYALATGESFNEAKKKVTEVLASGKAFAKLKEMLEFGGANLAVFDNPDGLLISDYVLKCNSKQGGYITGIDAYKIAKFVQHLKNETDNDKQKLRCGILLNKKIGDYVQEDELLLKVFSAKKVKQEDLEMLYDAFTFGEKNNTNHKLVLEVIK